MIEQLLLFKESGILLLKKNIAGNSQNDADELVSGFLSALFQYFNNRFGKIEKIQTTRNLILIAKFRTVYVVLIASWIKDESDMPIKDNVYFLNRRLEDIAVKAMEVISRKVNRYFKFHPEAADNICYGSAETKELDNLINTILETEKEKIEIIRSLAQSGRIKPNFSKIYEGF